MDKFVSKVLPFNNLCVSTANASALSRLAELLEQRKFRSFRTLIKKLDGRLSLRRGLHASVDSSLTIKLPDNIYPVLAQRLRTLAAAAQYERFYLGEIDQLLSEHSEYDWAIQRIECRPEPERDYSPKPAGTMWEAILFHKTSSVDVLEAAWNEIILWSGLENRFDTDKLDAVYQSPVTQTPNEAFNALVHGRAPDHGSGGNEYPYQVTGFCTAPFYNWYGEPRDWLQVWFEKDRIILITADRHAETGIVDWDLKNFFIFHAIVRTVSSSVNSDRFSWWIDAENQADANALPIDKLEDVDALWDIFLSLVDADRGPQDPKANRKVDWSQFETSLSDQQLPE